MQNLSSSKCVCNYNINNSPYLLQVQQIGITTFTVYELDVLYRMLTIQLNLIYFFDLYS